MSIHYFADFVGQLAMAGVTLALVTLIVFYILRRSSASLRVLGFTVTLLVHTLIFGLISGVQIHAFMQSGDSKIAAPSIETETFTPTVATPLPLHKIEIDFKQNKITEDIPSVNEASSVSLTSKSTPSPFIKIPAAFATPLSIFGFIWGGGTLLLLGYWIRQFFQLRKIINVSVPITQDISGKRKNTRILLSDSKNTAFCCGIIKPSIIISKELYECLRKEERDLIIDHEMAHLGAGDTYLIQIQFFAAALFWWLPTTWLLGQGLITACEQRCDSMVLQSGAPSKIYAELLLKVAALSPSRPLQNSLPISRKYKETKKRIQQIMNNQNLHRPLSSRQKWISSAMTILTTASIFSLCSQLTIADEQAKKDPLEKKMSASSTTEKNTKIKEIVATEPAKGLRIQCDGGMSFNKKTIVYRGNVTLSYPPKDITITAKDGVTAYLGKTSDDPQTREQIGTENYKDMAKVIAKGDVRISYRGVGDQDITASSENLIYDDSKRTITLKGGLLSIKHGSNIMRATEEDQYITINLNDSKFETSSGSWEIEATLPK